MEKMVTTTAPLEVLDLSQYSTTIDNKALIAITDFAGSRPRVIDISGCFHITDEGFSHMVNEIGIGGDWKCYEWRLYGKSLVWQ